MSTEIYNEIELLKASMQGDTVAFEAIVKEYQSFICAITYSATADFGKSEELAQETFISVWKNLTQLKEPNKFKGWISSIARNIIRNFFRSQKQDLLRKSVSLNQIHEIGAKDEEPLEVIISQEQQAVVGQALKQIPEIYREPLVLFYRKQQSVKQVAEELDLSEQVAKQRLTRGRKMLKEQVVAMVETAISSSGPSKAFTVSVITAISAIAIEGASLASTAAIETAATTNVTGITAVMSGLTAKIITTVAIAIVTVGAIITYNVTKNNTDTPLKQEQTATQTQEESDITDNNQKDYPESNKKLEITMIQATANEEIIEPVTEQINVSQKQSEYQFKPQGVLSGLITDKATGEPVVGAGIVIYRLSIPGGKLLTDSNGFYSLGNIEESKEHQISIESIEYVGKPNIDDRYKLLIDKNKQQVLNFQLERACKADLWVKDEQGKPVEGAEIKIIDISTNQSVAASRCDLIKSTNKEGYTFIGGLPPSENGYLGIITHKGQDDKLITIDDGYKYTVKKPDFAPEKIIIDNTNPDIIPIFNATMRKGISVKGHIEYSDGVAASDLEIVSEPCWHPQTLTSLPYTDINPDGSFTLTNITPERYSILVYDPIEKSQKQIQTIDFSKDHEYITLVFPEPSPQSLLSIKGIIKIISKASIDDSHIDISSYNTTNHTHGNRTSLCDYNSNDETKFEINRLEKGNYTLRFSSEHFKDVVLEDVIPPVDDIYIVMEQIVKPEITAIVIDKSTGKPVTNMKARLVKTAYKENGDYCVNVSWLERNNPEGKASFNVTPGFYQVQIMAEGYSLGTSEEIEIDSDNPQPVIIELTRGGNIKGRVINSENQPVPEAEILSLSYASGNGIKSRDKFTTKNQAVLTDINGTFILENLPEGFETIKVIHKDYAPTVINGIAVFEGKTTEGVIIKLQAGAVIEGYVFDNDGNPISDETINYIHNGNNIAIGRADSTITDIDGYYRIEGLDNKPYLLTRNHGRFANGIGMRTITPICGDTTRFDFGGEGYIVTGTLIIDNIFSPNTKLTLRSKTPRDLISHATTDPEGNFLFSGIESGQYYILPTSRSNMVFADVNITNTDIDLDVVGNNFVEFEVVIESHEDWKQLQSVAIISSVYISGHQRNEIDKQNRLWRFINIIPGKHELTISNHSTNFTTKVDIVAGQTEPFNIKPPKLDATITGSFFRSTSNKSIPRYLLLSNDTKTISAYLVLTKDGVADTDGEFEVKLPAGQYQISHFNGKDKVLIREFEISSSQQMQLEIDLDAIGE